MRMKSLLKIIVESNDTRTGQCFDLTIQVFIILSIITFSLDTLPNLSDSTSRFLSLFEYFVICVFTLEYAVRVYVADRKRDYVLSFYGIIDFIAILPFYLSLGVDLRSVRILRILRLFRLFKLVRYNKAIQRLLKAFVVAKEEIVLFSVVTIILLYLSATGIYYFENEAQPEEFQSIFHSLWWAVATLTTVGYGDIYPITVGGQIFTFFILMIGLGIVALPAGLLASALSQVRFDEQTQPEQNTLQCAAMQTVSPLITMEEETNDK